MQLADLEHRATGECWCLQRELVSWPGARNADEEQRQNGTSTGAGQAGNETRLRSLQGHYDRGKETQEEVDRGSLEEERESDPPGGRRRVNPGLALSCWQNLRKLKAGKTDGKLALVLLD